MVKQIPKYGISLNATLVSIEFDAVVIVLKTKIFRILFRPENEKKKVKAYANFSSFHFSYTTKQVQIIYSGSLKKVWIVLAALAVYFKAF